MSFDTAERAIADVIVPKSLLRDPHSFGGTDHGDNVRGCLIVRDGHAQRLEIAPETGTPRIVIPGLIEPHCHLDKCHSIDRMGAVGGDLDAAIAAQLDDKSNWTEADLRHRAARGLQEAYAAGCRTVRTHVDWSDSTDAPLAWHVLAEMSQDLGSMTLQRAALTGIDQMANAHFCTRVAQTVAQTDGILGSFVLFHERIDEGLRNVFAAADQFGLALDFHVDEGLGTYNGLEAIADVAISTGFTGPILCGHAVSLMDRTTNEVVRIADKLIRAGIAVCALPTTNLYLQGRTSGTPDRRGITRLRELHAHGVPVLIGSDNVGDAFCPMGAHDPMAALHLACLTGHLDPPLGRWLPAVTTDAARALGCPLIHVDDALVTDLLVSDATHFADLIAGRSALVPLSEAMKKRGL